MEDTTMSKNKQCLQRDITTKKKEVGMSRGGNNKKKARCGRKNMLDVCCEVTSHDEYVAMVKTKKRMSA